MLNKENNFISYQEINNRYLNEFDAFIHLAGKAHDLKNVSNKNEYYEVNTELTKKIFDVHLMIKPVDNFIENFAKAGADIITFHPEASENIEETIKLIKKQGVKVGISLKPKSKISLIEKYLEEIDLVLIMSVEPGFGGQKFMPEVLSKVKILRQKIDEENLKVEIESLFNTIDPISNMS